jgi:hypothetical protein
MKWETEELCSVDMLICMDRLTRKGRDRAGVDVRSRMPGKAADAVTLTR